MLYTPPRRLSPAAFCRPRAARTVCVRPVRNAPCLYCRCDRNAAQLEGAAANADAAARQGALPLLLMHADATRLPLHDGSVDADCSRLSGATCTRNGDTLTLNVTKVCKILWIL